MTTRIYTKITPEMAKKVLDYFYNYDDNRTNVIAKRLNLKHNLVNYILDLHLKYKKNAYISENYQY